MKYLKTTVLIISSILAIIILIWWFLFHKRVETYENAIMTMIDEFCNKQYGNDWTIDSIVRYNDKLYFAVVRIKEDVKISFSIQPIVNTIIIEDVHGNLDVKTTNTRVHNVGKLKNKK